MISNFYIKIFSLLTEIIDYSNKKKTLFFFKKELKDKVLTIIDIGAHKGETINFFMKNFYIKKIFAFEPNKSLFKDLEKKRKNNQLKLFNFGVGEKNEVRYLNIMTDSSSSTFNTLNENSNYFKKKKKILSFFLNENVIIKKIQKIEIVNLSEIISSNNIEEIDVLKIDTEGFEFNVLKGIKKEHLENIHFIHLEHHYDLMIDKGYKFRDIDKFLKLNHFVKRFKLKMKFRKSFEYIYENSKKY